MGNRNFYRIQADGLVDNPDQRINSDIASFTGTALGFGLTIFSSLLDLFSFSGILFTIYPPLFGVLIGATQQGRLSLWLKFKCGGHSAASGKE